MFTYDEKQFFSNHHEENCCPPQHHHFSLPEKADNTARMLKDTLDRLIMFERTMKEKYDDLFSIMTEDNVTFKDLMQDAYKDFVSAVRSEVNLFETNTNGIVALFKDAVNTRLAEFNKNHSEAFAEYQEQLTVQLNEFEDVIRDEFDGYKNDVTNIIATFTTRLDTQDNTISDAVMYMKTNLGATLENLLNEMHDAGEIEGILSSDVKNALKTKRVYVVNEEGTVGYALEIVNFAGQGSTQNNYGVVVHNYTDSPSMRLDNVGDGAIIQAVNAFNPEHRSDKDSTFHGGGEAFVYMVQEDNDGDGSHNQHKIFAIDKDAGLWWSGWGNNDAGSTARNHTAVFQTNKLDGGTWAFKFDAAQLNRYLMLLSTAGKNILNVQTNENGVATINAPAGAMLNSSDFLNFIAGGPMVFQTGDATNNAIRFRINGSYYYPQMTNKFCTSTSRPSTNVSAGEIYMETDTNRTIRRNSVNNGWVDMNGNPV